MAHPRYFIRWSVDSQPNTPYFSTWKSADLQWRMVASDRAKIKGVILAGGNGTRLLPMTRVTNKHLLPVYDRPMVFFPLQALVQSGIEEVMLITGGSHPGDFVHLLGNGRAFGLRELSYGYQEGAGGIADALRLAEDFADGQPLVVMLGDNLMQEQLKPHVQDFANQLSQTQGLGARILLKEVEDPGRFGVAEVNDDESIISIVEKPAQPRSRQAVIGTYMYDAQVFDIIRTLTPSKRGELEITDVNQEYLNRGQLEWSQVEGWWSDAGTVPSLFQASKFVAQYGANGEGAACEAHRDDLKPRQQREQ